MTLLTPAIPMLFMGEEYGEKAPFEYFVDYENEKLTRSIFEGRKREFSRADMPFPGQESFDNSQLTWEYDHDLFTLYKSLIAIRKWYPAKEGIKGSDLHVYQEDHWIAWEYPTETGDWLGVFIYLGSEPAQLASPFQKVKGERLLATEQVEGWNLPSECCLVYT